MDLPSCAWAATTLLCMQREVCANSPCKQGTCYPNALNMVACKCNYGWTGTLCDVSAGLGASGSWAGLLGTAELGLQQCMPESEMSSPSQRRAAALYFGSPGQAGRQAGRQTAGSRPAASYSSVRTELAMLSVISPPCACAAEGDLQPQPLQGEPTSLLACSAAYHPAVLWGHHSTARAADAASLRQIPSVGAHAPPTAPNPLPCCRQAPAT